MKDIVVEDSIYAISDRNYKKIHELSKVDLETLEYNDILRLLVHLGATMIGKVYMSSDFNHSRNE